MYIIFIIYSWHQTSVYFFAHFCKLTKVCMYVCKSIFFAYLVWRNNLMKMLHRFQWLNWIFEFSGFCVRFYRIWEWSSNVIVLQIETLIDIYSPYRLYAFNDHGTSFSITDLVSSCYEVWSVYWYFNRNRSISWWSSLFEKCIDIDDAFVRQTLLIMKWFRYS